MDNEREITNEQIRSLLEGSGTDAVIITDPYNLRYVSAFAGEGVAYISNRRRVLITDARYTEAAEKETSFEVMREGRGDGCLSRYDIINECLKADGAELLGYEDRDLTCAEFAEWERRTVKTALAPLGGRVSELRQIKKPWEKDLLSEAEAIGDRAFSAMQDILRPGMTEIEAAAELEYALRENGGEGISFDTIVASGANSSMPHAVPGRKVIEKGDLVTLDFGCRYKGYCSDMTRTVVIGQASPRQKEIYNIVLEANMAVISEARGGMTGSEIDAIARGVIEDAGFGEYFGHSLGHGIGLEIHEEPNCSPSEKRIIKPGMVESDEPGIYIPGKCGVRIEDMVYYTETGLEVLSSSTKELIEI